VKRRLVLIGVLCVAGLAYDPSAGSRIPAFESPPDETARDATSDKPQLKVTPHPVLSDDINELWFVPAQKERARQAAAYDGLAEAAGKFADGDFAASLKLATRAATTKGSLQDYAKLYVGLSQLRLERSADARRTLEALRKTRPEGYLAVAAALGSGEAAEAEGDHRAAASIYAELAADKTTLTDEVLLRLGRSSLAAGDRKQAAEAYRRVYYEFALSDLALTAAGELGSLQDHIVRSGYQDDLGRAAILFGARRYTDARQIFEQILNETSGDDRELVELRIAECDFFLRRYKQAIAGLTPHLDRASRKAEARFFYLSALRESGQHDQHVAMTRALVDEFPESSWSEEALNNLGTHYILNNEDALAAEAFAELYKKFPTGEHAERAAWKAGWWSYKNGDYAGAARVFDSAAQAFPRSNYRPSFLYWSARAHAKLDRGAEAIERFRVVHADYGNSYYGRLASQKLGRDAALGTPDRAVAVSRQPVSTEVPRPPTEGRIRTLLAAGLYDDAVNELRHAQRSWGGSSALDATLAWAYQQKGELRRAIALMRRAYPQFLTRGGHDLPIEIQQVIFPLTYWTTIKKHAAARDLDPYLIAALIAQESTFDPKIRSSANAWGLMQIVPSTGRRLARSLGIRRFRTSILTNAETNVRMGTLYFSQLVNKFGGTHFALASYNAGESRVARWKAERPGLDEDEFIDDIPFPETQNYVKRILGTAEDYRRIYGTGGAGRVIPVAGEKPAAKPTAKPAARRRSGQG
jgi:soluble lytic murein transglycosylase